MTDIVPVLNKLNEPAPFRSSVAFAKDGKDTLRFSIENMGTGRGLSASLKINDGRSGEYSKRSLASIDEAFDALDNMYTTWLEYKGRFKGRELSDSDMSDLLYT